MSNKELIYDLVKNHFSLSKESLALFKDRLYNPVYSDIYKNFGLDENHRKYWKIDNDKKQYLDRGWAIFQSNYPSFCSHYNVTYSDFSENRIVDEKKNQVKLIKAISNFYMDRNDDKGCLSSKVLGGKYEYYYEFFKSGRYSHSFLNNGEIKLRNILITAGVFENIDKFDEVFTKEAYYNCIRDIVKEEMDYIGTKRLSNKEDLYLVLSLNFEDWFFCSTGENWTSCLNLYSDYMYWVGLPGLVTDPNRAMIYITNKEEKRPLESRDMGRYAEIRVEKLLSRSWVLLDEDNFIHVTKAYPFQMIDSESIAKIIDYNKVCSLGYSPFSSYTKSKEPFRLLYHVNGSSTTIFYDGLTLHREGEEKYENTLFKCYYGQSGGTCYYSPELRDIIRESDLVSSRGGSIGELVYYKTNLDDRFFDPGDYGYCADCDRFIDLNNDNYYVYDGQYICGCCFEDNYIYCENCNQIEIADESCYVEGHGCYCLSCYDELFFTCSECETEESVNNEVYLERYKISICQRCYNEYYSYSCDECGESDFCDEDVKHVNGKTYCYDCYDKVAKKETA